MSEIEGTTKDVEIMLGNPKKALLAMAIPIMIANLIQSINNIIDTVWLTSIGVDAQAAVNVIFPLFFFTIGLGNGIAVGASQAIARRIGAMDREGANRAAAQAIVLTLIISLIIAVAFILCAEQLIIASGGASNLEACIAYAIPIFVGIPTILVADVFSGLLRSEGASRRSMILHVIGAGLNIVLDPIFIFVLDMGVGGAAIATTLAMSIPLILVWYWYFGKRDTFISIPLRGFRFDGKIMADILRVGIPASLELILMSLVMILMNDIIDGIAPVEGVAIFGNGWKILDLFFMPTMAIGFAVVPICAAALGARDAKKIRDVYALALKYGIVIMLMISVIVVLFSQYLVIPFSYSEATVGIRDEMAEFLLYAAVFLPFCPLGYTSAGYFQSMGWGLKSLSISAVLNFVRLPICLFMAIEFGTLESLWAGVVIAEIIGAAYGGAFGIYSVRKLLRGGYPKLLRKEDFIDA